MELWDKWKMKSLDVAREDNTSRKTEYLAQAVICAVQKAILIRLAEEENEALTDKEAEYSSRRNQNCCEKRDC